MEQPPCVSLSDPDLIANTTTAPFATPPMERLILAGLAGSERGTIDLRQVLVVHQGLMSDAVGHAIAEVRAMSIVEGVSSAASARFPHYHDYGTERLNASTTHRIEALGHLTSSRPTKPVVRLDFA